MIIAAILMAEESDQVLLKSVLWLQERQEMLKEGFSLDYEENYYTFIPTFIDRGEDFKNHINMSF